MPIPDYEKIMLPLLQYASDNKEHSNAEVIDALATQFALSQEETEKLLPSGREKTFSNRVRWARWYMERAGLLESPQRGYFKITERGLAVSKNPPIKIDNAFLRQFEEFREFQGIKRDIPDESDIEKSTVTQTPEESLDLLYQQLNQTLVSDILQNIKSCSPTFFEQLVIDVLVAMGYGGSRKEAGKAIGKSGDGGIDGIINEDRLGLDMIYIQAKRWDNTIGRPEVQKFAGALLGQHAKKGILITTSTFTDEAQQYAKGLDNKLILIDGQSLAEFMIELNIGTKTRAHYDIKETDLDYFTEQ